LRSCEIAANCSSKEAARKRAASSESLASQVVRWSPAIDGVARAIDPTSAIERLQPILGARRIGDQIFIGATKLFEGSLLIVAFIDGFDLSQAEQSGELLGIFIIGFVPVADELVVTRVADRHRGDQGFE
jgi:hypothetical protein